MEQARQAPLKATNFCHFKGYEAFVALLLHPRTGSLPFVIIIIIVIIILLPHSTVARRGATTSGFLKWLAHILLAEFPMSQ